jgi:hypothetical protein
MESTADSEPTTAPARSRRFAVGALLVAGTICAFLAIASIWISRQALETDSWTDTSSQLLQDKEIKTALSGFLVDQLYSQADPAAQIREALPPRAQPLAGPASSALRDFAQRAAYEALGRPRVQALWEKANRAAHEQLLQVIDGGGSGVSTEGGVVKLNLGSMLQDFADRTGVGGKVAAKIGPDGAQVEVLRSDQLGAAQDIAHALKPLALVLTLLGLAFFGGAIALAGERRRQAMRAAGFGFIIAGALALVARSVAGGAVVDSLASTEAIKPAISSTWEIGTSMLVEVATASIVYGVAIVLAAWLAGPTRVAVAARRGLAPYLRSPAYAWGGLAVLVLLLLWWAPTPGLRRVVPSIVLLALLAIGLVMLRRQTTREYPDAAEPHPGASLHDAYERVRDMALTRGRHGAETVHNGHGNGAAAPPAPDPLADLERLAALHDRGALTDEEFTNRKRELFPAAP